MKNNNTKNAQRDGELNAQKIQVPIRLRKRGSLRGIVLVDTRSFLAWPHGQPAVTKVGPVKPNEPIPPYAECALER